MRTLTVFLLLAMFGLTATAQVKIGQNPESIDPASILELDDNNKALVLTRISDANMNGMSPLRGALVYNTDQGCVFYYDGTNWLNLCSGAGTTNESLVFEENTLILTDSNGDQVSVALEAITEQTFTTDPIENFRQTILITQNGSNYNFEVLEITGEQIADFTIQGIDIAEETIRSNNLAPNSVGQSELSENSVGVSEIDLNQVTVSSFLNDAGYITAGAIISPEPNNDIYDNNGIYYSSLGLQTQITTNTNNLSLHLAEDQDLSDTNELVTDFRLEGNSLILEEGSNTFPVSLEGIGGGGAVDGVVSNVAFDGTNLNFTGANGGFNGNVDISSLGGGGTADGSETIINPTGTNVTVTGTGTTGDPYTINALIGDATDGVITNVELNGTDLEFTGSPNGGFTGTISLAGLGGGGSTELADQVTIIGDGSAGDEFRIRPSDFNGQYLRTDPTTGVVIWDDLPAGTGGNTVFTDNSTIIGDGQGTPLTLGNLGAANNQILKWNAGAGNWEAQDDRYAPNVFFGFQDSPFTGNRELFVRDSEGNEVGVEVAQLQAELGTGGGGNPTDEIQDLQLDGGTNILTITNNATATPIDLSPFLNDTNTTNASLTQDGTDLILTDSDNNTVTIPLADISTGADTNTTNASLTEDGTNLILTDSDTNTVTIPLATLAAAIDTDTNTTNATLTQDGTDLILTDSDNNTVTIPLADISTGADTNTTNASLTEDGTNLILTDSDTNTVTIPLATLAAAIDTDTNTTNATLTQDGTDLILTDSDNNTVTIPLADISTGADANTTNASLTEDGTNLILTDSDTNTVTIPLATLAAAIDTDTNTTNATLTQDGTDLILTDSDNNTVTIPLADLSTGADTNFAEDNLILDAPRNHDLAGNNLVFTGTGDFGIGNFGVGPNPATPTSKFHVLGQIRASSFANGNGGANLPSYRFENDLNSGMWLPGNSELGFSVGGNEALRIDGTGANTKVIIQQDLELEGTLTDFNGNVGTAGQILSSTGGGVEWVAPTASGTIVSGDVGNIIAASVNDGGAYLSNANLQPDWNNIQNIPADVDDGDENTNFAIGGDITMIGPRNHNLNGNNLVFGGLTGNFGIGNGANPPQARFHVDGTGQFDGTVSTFGTRNTAGSLPANVSYSFLVNSSTGMDLTNANTSLGLITNDVERVRINAAGDVGIGLNFPGAATIDAMLHVAGTVRADGGFLSADTTIDVPDYVFQNYFDGFSSLKADYEFQSLTDIEAFVKEHKHLPGITSAAQAQKDGFWNLSQSNLQNLEKIEELFLHTIEQQKKIDSLSKENQNLKSELDGLKAEVEAIKKALLKN